jgi:hypothetical protein
MYGGVAGESGRPLPLCRSAKPPTLCPGTLLLSPADLNMFRTCKSLMHTIAWFWPIVVGVLCRKSLLRPFRLKRRKAARLAKKFS